MKLPEWKIPESKERESGNLGKRGQASSQGDNPSRLQGEQSHRLQRRISPHCIRQDDLIQGLKVDTLGMWRNHVTPRARRPSSLGHKEIHMYSMEMFMQCIVNQTGDGEELRKVNLKKYWKI